MEHESNNHPAQNRAPAGPYGVGAPARPDGAAPAANAATGNGPAYITQVTPVRRESSDAKEVEEAGKKKKQPNWLATLYRGEQVTVLSTRGDWLVVRTSDEKTGWVKLDSVLSGAGLEMATVLDKSKMFSRPDLLALLGTRAIEPGSLLFSLRAKDQFSEVNVSGTSTVWVLTDVLSKDPKEVDAAKLLHKARLLKEKNDPAADGLLDLARTQFASTRLVQTQLLAPPADPNSAAADANGLAPAATGDGAGVTAHD
jgi:hypothetical protein